MQQSRLSASNNSNPNVEQSTNSTVLDASGLSNFFTDPEGPAALFNPPSEKSPKVPQQVTPLKLNGDSGKEDNSPSNEARSERDEEESEEEDEEIKIKINLEEIGMHEEGR